MKKIVLITLATLISISSFAQNRIDAKYKKPGQQNSPSKFDNVAQLKAKLVDSLFAANPIKPKTEYQKMMDIYYAELKAFNQNGNEVWIYEDEFFNGTKKKIQVGNYNIATLGIFWNDKISSILIPQSLKVEVYINDDFKDATTTLFGWGLASLQHSSTQSWVGNRPNVGSYNGNSSTFRDDKGNVIAELNDNISSLKITVNSACCKP